jgi:hypothetical protein
MFDMAVIAIVLSTLGLLGGAVVMYTKLVRFMTGIENTLAQMAPMVKRVPGLFYRIYAIEQHLDFTPPEIPEFMNGSSKQ